MLMRTIDGSATKMLHKGIWYEFRRGEVKEVPESMLMSFRGVLVSAEPPKVILPKLTIINAQTEPIKKSPKKSNIKQKNQVGGK